MHNSFLLYFFIDRCTLRSGNVVSDSIKEIFFIGAKPCVMSLNVRL